MKTNKKPRHGTAQHIKKTSPSYIQQLCDRHPLAASVFACLLVFAAGFFLIKNRYYINDDKAITGILSGQYGSASPKCIFVNQLLSYPLYLLFQLFPGFNWFYLLLQTICFATCVTILYLILTTDYQHRIYMGALFLAGVYMPLLSIMTFTTAAYFALITGLLLLTKYTIIAEKFAPLPVAAGCFLVFLGIMVRRSLRNGSIPLFLLLLLLAAIAFVSKRKTAELKKSLKKMLIFCGCFILSLAVAYSAWALNDLAYASGEWEGFLAYNHERSKLQDYPLQTDNLSDVIANVGMSENDYEMFAGFFHYNPELYTPQCLEALNNQNTPRPAMARLRTALRRSIPEVSSLEKLNLSKIMFVLLCFMALLLAFQDRKLETVLMCGSVIAFVKASDVLFYFLGRKPERVSFCVVAFAFIVLIFLCIRAKMSFPRMNTAQCLIIICAIIISLKGINIMNDYSSAKAEIKTYIKQNPSSMFVIPAGTDISAQDNCWKPPEKIENMMPVGGWLSYSPMRSEVEKKFFPDKKLEAIVDKEDMYFIGTKQNSESLKTYLKERGFSDVKFNKVYTNGGLTVYSINSQPK